MKRILLIAVVAVVAAGVATTVFFVVSDIVAEVTYEPGTPIPAGYAVAQATGWAGTSLTGLEHGTRITVRTPEAGVDLSWDRGTDGQVDSAAYWSGPVYYDRVWRDFLAPVSDYRPPARTPVYADHWWLGLSDTVWEKGLAKRLTADGKLPSGTYTVHFAEVVPEPAAGPTSSPAQHGALASGRLATGATVFSCGFEDATTPFRYSGDPTWATTSYRAAVGQRSSYCAGSAIFPPGPYVNGTSSWMTTGPLDLSKASSAVFSFKTWYKTEQYRDLLWASVSVDGTTYHGWSYSGDSQGWIDVDLDLTNVPKIGNVCGRSQVWIGFVFRSGPDGVDEGAYVDEVRVTARGITPPSLTLEADAQTVPYNGSVGFTARLRDGDSGAPVPDKEVGLFWTLEEPLSGVLNPAGAFMSTTGDYSMQASGIQRRTYFVAAFAGDSVYQPSMSNVVEVMARADVAPAAVPAKVRAGKLITSWGSIRPLHSPEQNTTSHTKVYVERYSRGKWRPVVSLWAGEYKNTASATKYSMSLRYVAGKWRVRGVHQDDDHAMSTSAWRVFTAR